MKKLAIIIGSSGQDGTLAFEYLSQKGYSIIGIDSKTTRTKDYTWNEPIDITKREEVNTLINKTKPDIVYHLAAFHHSSQDSEINNIDAFDMSYKVNVFSLVNFLESIRLHSPKTKVFYASSCLIFGDTETTLQTETTPFNPDTIYGITKLDGLLICRLYRKNYNMFVSTGIFYNHESHLRMEKFVSRKIIQGAVDIKRGKKKELEIGSLNSEVDWGYAPDFVDAIYKILNYKNPDDFIVATRIKHTVSDLAESAFGELGLDYREYIKESSAILTRTRKPLIGDSTKLNKATGWKPSLSFEEMVKKITQQVKKEKL